MSDNETFAKDSILNSIFQLRAVRKFQDRPIDPADIDLFLRAATMAASSGNTQPWEFMLIQDRVQKLAIQQLLLPELAKIDARRSQSEKELVDATGRSVTGHATLAALPTVPLLVLVFWNPDRGIRMKGEYEENPDGTYRQLLDLPGGRGSSIYPACQNMMLAAHALGIGSVFTAAPGLAEKQIKELAGVPPRMFFQAGIYFGYRDEKLGPPRRRPLSEVAHVGHWDTPYSYEAK